MGNMGQVILTGILNSQLFEPENILVYDVNYDKADMVKKKYGVQWAATNQCLIEQSNVVILCIKPQTVTNMLQSITLSGWEHKLLISILAGVHIKTLAQLTADKMPITRVMPNTPCLIQAGISALAFNEYVSQKQKELVINLFRAIGETCVLDEELLDAVTGVSGSGPAYIYMMLEAMIDGGVKMGLPRDVSRQLAIETMLGAAKMVKQTGKHPGELKDMVTSPGGTTIAAVASLEENGLRTALIKAVEVATTKAKQLIK